MRIGGLQKITLLDFPGAVACTVFTSGCNLRCPFCHNAPLVDALGDDELFGEELLFTLLKKRKGVLDGVAITGGEPLMQRDIEEFISKIKALGFKVKLDTNGTYPEKLKSLLQKGLLDYVAMDVKAPVENYGAVAGTDAFGEKIKESIKLLLGCNIPYEFRTTVVKELHSEDDFHKIGELIKGAKAYYIQCFKDSGNILGDGLSAPSKEDLENYLSIARKYVENTSLRGID